MTPQTDDEYRAMLKAWTRSDKLRVMRAAGLSASKVADLDEFMVTMRRRWIALREKAVMDGYARELRSLKGCDR